MRFKRPIYRIIFYSAWMVVFGGIITLLVAANRRNKAQICMGVEVKINGGGDKIYVEKDEVLKSIEQTAKGPLTKKHFGAINLTQLEKTLEANPWIRDAELYFDTKDVLHVAISEREPVARVFTTAGNSFYIDSAGHAMPLLESYSVKLPVVTGFTAAKKWNASDSAILEHVKQIVGFIGQHQFWNAQVGQIDIVAGGKFELVPVIGSHIIKLGSADHVEEKLHKLFVFYKQVLAKAGLAKYSALDVQFDGQVIGVKKGPQSPVDSIQLQKNILELMEKKALEQEAETMLSEQDLPAAIVVNPARDSSKTQPANLMANIPKTTTTNPTQKKPTEQRSNLVKPKEQTKTPQKPKAVMGKRLAD